MRKIFFTFLVVLGCINVSNAQIAGIKGGFNMANLYGESSKKIETNPKAGYYAGILVEIPLKGNRLFLQPEVVYSKQGVKFDEAYVRQDLTLDYINVPLLFKAKVLNFFSVQLGPQFGFVVNSPSIITTDGKEFRKGIFSGMDFGLVAGVSYYTPSGFFLEARYNLGLKNIFTNKLDDNSKFLNSPESNFKNNIVSLGLGYLF